MSTSDESGVTNLASPYSVDDTTQRLVRVLEQAGMMIFDVQSRHTKLWTKGSPPRSTS
jgi:uncharacterized protein (DUF302 family)